MLLDRVPLLDQLPGDDSKRPRTGWWRVMILSPNTTKIEWQLHSELTPCLPPRRTVLVAQATDPSTPTDPWVTGSDPAAGTETVMESLASASYQDARYLGTGQSPPDRPNKNTSAPEYVQARGSTALPMSPSWRRLTTGSRNGPKVSR